MIHGWITLFKTILQAKLNDIHLQFLTQFINRRFQREGSLRCSRSAISAYAHLICHHLKTTEVEMRATITTAKDKTPKENCGPCICTGVKNDCPLHCNERAIIFRANLQGNN